MSRGWRVTVGLLLASTFLLPVAVVAMVLSDPGLEFKEFVYVGGQEIERIDLYYVIPGILRAGIPFAIVVTLVTIYWIVSRIRTRAAARRGIAS